MFNQATGKRIRRLREENELTRDELAAKAEITSKFLYEVESGKKGLSASTLLKIARALSSSCDYILTGVNGEDVNSMTDHICTDMLKGFTKKQRKIVKKIIEVVLEIDEK